MVMSAVRVAICGDFLEEQWPSMDRVADMLIAQLRRDHAGAIEPTAVRPPFVRRATREASMRSEGAAFAFDRLANRLWDYPRHARAVASAYDVYHVIDHSYAQLVHRFPAQRTVVTCHDLDTFRSVLHPHRDVRSAAFRLMTRHILSGLRRAARITCDTAAVRDEILSCELVPADRLLVVPIGVSDTYSPAADPDADRAAARLTASAPDAIDVLHVGSTIARKRIDVLLDMFAGARRNDPRLHLVRAGGPFTPEQRRRVCDLGLTDSISELPRLDERTLAAVYRRAAVVVQPSAREGFGLPIIEAMACGTPVIASDIPPLREVAGADAEFCAVGDVSGWTQMLTTLVDERCHHPERWTARQARGRDRARSFGWTAFAAALSRVYEELAASPEPAEGGVRCPA
jgi:glycosyltransferase involved in cell wall biosynthesis